MAPRAARRRHRARRWTISLGAATLVLGVDLGFEAAIMAGIAAFVANVFMIDGLARDIVRR